MELLNLVAVTVPFDTCQTGIHDKTDTGNGQGSFGDIGCQDDSPGIAGFEDTFLLLCGKPCIKRQDLHMWGMLFPERLSGLTDFPFPRQENQRIT